MPDALELPSDAKVYLVSDISRLMLNAIKHESGFNATRLIESFVNILPHGNLLIPGFVNLLPDGDKIDMRTLKPETGGLSKEAFALFKKGKCSRTNDPFHSFFVFGNNADEWVKNTDGCNESFGENSAFGYLHQQGGIMIMMDLQLYYGFTFAHYVEQQLKVKYRQLVPYHFDFINSQGVESKKTISLFAKKKGYLPTLNGLEKALINANALKILYYNEVKIFRIDLQQAFKVIENDITQNKARNLIDFNLSVYLKQTIKQFTHR